MVSNMFIGAALNQEVLEYQCLMCKLREHSQRYEPDVHCDIEAPAEHSDEKGTTAATQSELPAYEKSAERARPRPASASELV